MARSHSISQHLKHVLEAAFFPIESTFTHGDMLISLVRDGFELFLLDPK